jgi:hypothetical protein
MPQNLGNFRHRRAVANHHCRQTVTEQMSGSAASGAKPGTNEGQADNMANCGGSRESDAWRPHAKEDLS